MLLAHILRLLLLSAAPRLESVRSRLLLSKDLENYGNVLLILVAVGGRFREAMA